MVLRRFLLAVVLVCSPAWAAPAEVQGLVFGDADTLAWGSVAGTDFYNVYRGELVGLRGGAPARCHGHPVAGTSFVSAAKPPEGGGFFYLVTAESATAGEGTPGTGSTGALHPLLGSCSPVMRHHVLDRIGYGWDEWTRDRITVLGSLDAYIDEQLDPDSIDESTNTTLATRLAPLVPPESVFELIATQVVGGVYARRQLAEQVSSFWANHFNTDWRKVADFFEGRFPQCSGPTPPPQCDSAYPAKAHLTASRMQQQETTSFRDLTFAGSFREMLEISAKSPAMILFLDTNLNIASAPNENYARELLELSSMGVDGGYTQTDVEQLARVFTGWTTCKKATADLGNPTGPCIASYWLDTPAGDWVADFRVSQHDCNAKVLFNNTPQEVNIPSTCGNPSTGIQDVELALDAIAAHPSTPRFISRKILERFVTDEPTTGMIDALVAVWNDAGNPEGTGDMREVLAAALHLPEFLDPDRTRSKVKTPLEHFVSGLRATRGTTNGTQDVLTFLTNAQHLPFSNPVPTGYPENGADWVDTGNMLERQNFGIRLATSNNANFKSDVLALLTANGIPTTPGHAAEIVDFLSGVLFAGALTPAERQKAIDFLNTDDAGNPTSYSTTRIRETAGFLLGYAQFQEQ